MTTFFTAAHRDTLVRGWLAWVACSAGVIVGAAEPEPAPTNDGDDRSEVAAVTLRYRFSKDDVVHFEVRHEMELVTRKDAATETVRNLSTTRKHYRVVSVKDDGTAVIEPVIDHVRMEFSFNDDEPTVVDSDDPDDSPRQFRRILDSIGQPQARLTVDARGRLVSVEPLQARDDAEQKADDEQNRNFLIVLPDGPIRVGETWKDGKEDRLMVTVRITRTLQRKIELLRSYRLVSVTDGVAEIAARTSVLTPVNDPAIMAQLIQRTPNGIVEFDIDAGEILSRESTVDETVIGFAGDNSSLKATATRSERRLSAEDLAARPEPGKQ